MVAGKAEHWELLCLLRLAFISVPSQQFRSYFLVEGTNIGICLMASQLPRGNKNPLKIIKSWEEKPCSNEYLCCSPTHTHVLPWVKTLSSEFDWSYGSDLPRRGEVKPSCAWWDPLGRAASQEWAVSVMGYSVHPHQSSISQHGGKTLAE